MNRTRKLAFGGVMSALSLVSMFLSGVFPFAEYACPALAGVFLIALVIDFNKKTALIAYAAVALLSLFITPNKEAAILFIAFLGYYPILKSCLEQVKSRVLEWVLKMGLFNIAVVASYFVIVNILGMEEVLSQMKGIAEYGILVMLLLANVAFVIYDIALSGLISNYISRVKPKLKHLF